MLVYIVSWRVSLWVVDLQHGRSIKFWCIHLGWWVRVFVYRWDVCLADILKPFYRHSDESYLGWELVDMPLVGLRAASQEVSCHILPRGLPCWMTASRCAHVDNECLAVFTCLFSVSFPVWGRIPFCSSVSPLIPVSLFVFKFMHLAGTFIQSNLHWFIVCNLLIHAFFWNQTHNLGVL